MELGGRKIGLIENKKKYVFCIPKIVDVSKIACCYSKDRHDVEFIGPFVVVEGFMA